MKYHFPKSFALLWSSCVDLPAIATDDKQHNGLNLNNWAVRLRPCEQQIVEWKTFDLNGENE
jgi:hypothetical protein